MTCMTPDSELMVTGNVCDKREPAPACPRGFPPGPTLAGRTLLHGEIREGTDTAVRTTLGEPDRSRWSNRRRVKWWEDPNVKSGQRRSGREGREGGRSDSRLIVVSSEWSDGSACSRCSAPSVQAQSTMHQRAPRSNKRPRGEQ